MGFLSESDRDLAMLINGPVICPCCPVTTQRAAGTSLPGLGWDCGHRDPAIMQ
jgi:hypothetical protein